MREVARCIWAEALFLGLVAFLLLFGIPAWAVECPAPGPCKVLTLTPDEENILVGQQGIFDIAERGAAVVLGPPVKYFREKIQKAPQGDQPKPPEAPKKP